MKRIAQLEKALAAVQLGGQLLISHQRKMANPGIVAESHKLPSLPHFSPPPFSLLSLRCPGWQCHVQICVFDRAHDCESRDFA
jgi:hypothetical protein